MNIRIIPTGQVVKEYLKANGIRQKDISELTGYSLKQVSLILNDKAKMTLEFAEALEKILPGTNKDFWLRYAEKYNAQREEG